MHEEEVEVESDLAVPGHPGMPVSAQSDGTSAPGNAAQRSISPKPEQALVQTAKTDPPTLDRTRVVRHRRAAPREEELEFASPFEGPAAPEAMPALLVPPAPYFAEDFRLDDASAARWLDLGRDPAEMTPLASASLPREGSPSEQPPIAEPEIPQAEGPPESPISAEPPTAEETPTEEISTEETPTAPVAELEPTWPLPRKLLSQLTELPRRCTPVWVPRANHRSTSCASRWMPPSSVRSWRHCETWSRVMPCSQSADTSLESQASRVATESHVGSTFGKPSPN